MDAPDFRSDATKIPLPFHAVDAAPIPDGVALLAKDGRAGVVSGAPKIFFEIQAPAESENGGAPEPAPISSPIVAWRAAQLRRPSDLRWIDFVSRTVHQTVWSDPLPAEETTTSAFMRGDSSCCLVGQQLVEVRRGASGHVEEVMRRTLETGTAIGQTIIPDNHRHNRMNHISQPCPTAGASKRLNAKNAP